VVGGHGGGVPLRLTSCWRPVLLVLALAAVPVGAGQAEPPEGDWVLWYEAPARQWVEAVPIGNGRLGAMVFGGVEAERIQFNEDSLWTGQPQDYQHEGAAEHLPQIRKLLLEGKQREAERLASQRFMSVPLRQEDYEPFGDLKVSLPDHKQAVGYRRELDIDQAVARVRYRVGDATFTREVFASHPAQAIDGPEVVELGAGQTHEVRFR